VYRPLLETVPPVALQVTVVLLVPDTVALNCCCPLVLRFADVGDSETEMGLGETEIVAVAYLLESATLVAVTV